MQLSRKKPTWQGVFAAGVFALFLLDLLRVLLPIRAEDLYSTYGVVLTAAMAGVYFSRKGLSGPAEIKIFAAYTVWVLLTRWLNRDFYLFVDFRLVLTVLFSFLLFVVGTVLDSKGRESLLDILTLCYAGLFVLGSAIGLFAAFTNTYLHIPPENVWINIYPDGGMYNLNLFSCASRLGSAVRIYIAWALLVYQLCKRKNVFVRLLLVIGIVISHIAVAMCHSRNIQVSMSVSCGMLAMLVFLKLLKHKPLALQITVLPVVTALALALCFFSFNKATAAVSYLSAYTAPRFEAFYDALESKPDPEYFGIVLTAEELSAMSEGAAPAESDAAAKADEGQASAKLDMTDSRKISTNKTLSQRTYIWKAGILAVEQNPSIGLYGRLSNNIMDMINRIIREQVAPSVKEYKHHMHNAYMQTLMLTGIFGLLLVILWTIFMVVKMIKLFFAASPSATLAVKALTVPLAGTFLFNLAEVNIFTGLDISGACFFLIAGVFIAYYRDLTPCRNSSDIFSAGEGET